MWDKYLSDIINGTVALLITVALVLFILFEEEDEDD